MWDLIVSVPDHCLSFYCAPCEDLDQPGHPTSLIRVFAVSIKNIGPL